MVAHERLGPYLGQAAVIRLVVAPQELLVFGVAALDSVVGGGGVMGRDGATTGLTTGVVRVTGVGTTGVTTGVGALVPPHVGRPQLIP